MASSLRGERNANEYELTLKCSHQQTSGNVTTSRSWGIREDRVSTWSPQASQLKDWPLALLQSILQSSMRWRRAHDYTFEMTDRATGSKKKISVRCTAGVLHRRTPTETRICERKGPGEFRLLHHNLACGSLRYAWDRSSLLLALMHNQLSTDIAGSHSPLCHIY